ncbi:hypothetical protein [Streptomyces beijiangensis]|uniref:Uncharacterized protein n=1 Tax=Streptomyces beijiangensis TaxID=163361 RepID=A0A939F6K3_9ACTN|nr:hypothetical protein [Streptomyces beijiangensis]MBO0511335.1 hypothetical protein [Streptomyces beijiangensis]
MLKKMRNGAIAAMGGTLIASSLLLAPSASASQMGTQATECNTWKSSDGGTGYARCWGLQPLHQFRVKVTCVGDRGQKWNLSGPQKNKSGETSSVRCAGAPDRAGIITLSYTTGSIV